MPMIFGFFFVFASASVRSVRGCSSDCSRKY